MKKELPLGRGEAKSDSSPNEEAPVGENKDLDLFCSEIELEEISLKKWKEVNRSLDLRIPVYLSAEQADEGGSKEVFFSRMTKEKSAGSTQKKEKASYLLQWPPGTQKGFEITIPDLGDTSGSKKGSVIFVIEISRKSPK